jgi:hypothetical protein
MAVSASASACAVCKEQNVKLSACSRCKSSSYRVCSRECQGADWKRHKKDDCYNYVEGAFEAAETYLSEENGQKDCPICQETFTLKDFMRSKVEKMRCDHEAHVQCLKTLTEQHLQKMALQGKYTDDSNQLKCPLCRKFIGGESAGTEQQRWYDKPTPTLLHMALGFCFQQYKQGNGSMEEETSFIQAQIRKADSVNQHQGSLEAIDQAKEEFKQLLPVLRKATNYEERARLTSQVKNKMSMAVMMHLLPGTLTEKEAETETGKWMSPALQWIISLMLVGPYL